MKHASSRELFDYWSALRGAQPAPERCEIEPSAIRRALGDVFILGLDRAVGHPFRLAGTRVCALFGRELRNSSFLALWDAESRMAVGGLMDAVSEDSVGAVAGANATTAEGWRHDIEVLLLPLRHRGEVHARIIGVLAPITLPFWLGAARIERLALGTVRHLDPELAGPSAARLVSGAHSERQRGIFVVHEGGRR